MPFDPAIPQATDTLINSQSALLANMGQLDTSFNVDHMTFSAPANTGYHKQLSFNGPITDPGLASPQCSVYPKAVAGRTELFFENGVGNYIKQMTNLPLSTPPIPTGGTFKYIDTPWGVRFLWGNTTAINGARLITFPTAFLVNYGVVVSSINGSPQIVSWDGDALTSMKIYTAANSAVSFFVVGTIPVP